MCAGVFVNPETAFIGLYGVDPQYQKLGIGMSMWRKIMEHVGDRNAGLYAVPEHLAMYRDKAGFKWRDNKQLYIYESDTVRTRDLVKSLDGIHVDKIDDSLLERVVQYDEHVHRYRFWQSFLITVLPRIHRHACIEWDWSFNCIPQGIPACRCKRGYTVIYLTLTLFTQFIW